jgi:uncharacterized protein
MLIEVRSSQIQGVGVFATGLIATGDVVHRIDDSRVVDEAHPLKPELGEDPIHRDWLPDGTTVLMQGAAGRINHSCAPNVYICSARRVRFILAMRPINVGEELFFDYSIGAVNGDVWDCECGALNCRGRHKCDFFHLPPQRQLEYLPYLDPWFAAVHSDRILRLLDGLPPDR